MTEAGTISREDTLLQIRLITEGVRYEVKGQPKWEPDNDVWTAVPVIIPDWTGRAALLPGRLAGSGRYIPFQPV